MASLAFSFATSAREAQEVRKPVVSINDIQDLARTGQSAELRQMIETTIVNTGKFRIMERGDQGTSVLLKEQQGAKAGLYTSNTPGKVGGFEGVDFMVYGTITTGESDDAARYRRVDGHGARRRPGSAVLGNSEKYLGLVKINEVMPAKMSKATPVMTSFPVAPAVGIRRARRARPSSSPPRNTGENDDHPNALGKSVPRGSLPVSRRSPSRLTLRHSWRRSASARSPRTRTARSTRNRRAARWCSPSKTPWWPRRKAPRSRPTAIVS